MQNPVGVNMAREKACMPENARPRAGFPGWKRQIILLMLDIMCYP